MGTPKKITSMFRAGSFSHTEGYGTTADGFASHAEGYITVAGQSDSAGVAAHAEGIQTTALSNASHAEGWLTTVGNAAHSGHAEGIQTMVQNNAAHAEGYLTTASGGYAHAEGQGTTASGSRSHAEGYNAAAGGNASHAEGINTIASGEASHAEGLDTNASGEAAHAEGNLTTASGIVAHAEGVSTTASGDASHAEGYSTTASGFISHAEGENTTASGWASHAEGRFTTASGMATHAEGDSTTASGFTSHTEGHGTNASGDLSHAEGLFTDTNVQSGAHIMGQYGQATDPFSWFLANGSSGSPGLGAKIIGVDPGTLLTEGYIDGAWHNGGADYAEMFETVDGQPMEPGYFVTLEGKKIRTAQAGDDYILGVTSANYSVLANSGELRWKGKYLTDEWGRVQRQEVVVSAVTGEDGSVIIPERKELRPVLNPAWDNTREYVSRLRRPEWVAVGLVGQVLVRDDGTCQVNGYCTAAGDGIATAAPVGYRVLERTGDRRILILFFPALFR